MFKRFIVALALGLANIASAAEPKAVLLGSYYWHTTDSDFGGLSGLELSSNGLDFVVLSDRGNYFSGALKRNETGVVVSANLTGKAHLLSSKGKPLTGGLADSEGLALPSGRSGFISFEGQHRIARVDLKTGKTENLPRPQAFQRFQANSSLEALAIDGAGNLYTFPERSGRLDRPFPVYRFDGVKWENFGTISRKQEFLVVGADFGPDGRLYVLERWFTGVGFASRVMRYDHGAKGFHNPTEIFQSVNGSHDNLEGISVWEDANGIHLTMVSDDNFRFFQRTELVDYLIRD